MISKRYIDTSPDGATQLFTTQDEYVGGTVWLFEVKSTGETQLREVVEMTGTFIQLNPAPEAGSKLYITYDVEVDDEAEDSGMTPWEHGNLNKLLETMKAQQDAMDSLSEALPSRVTQVQFNAWASVLEQELRDLKSTLLDQ